MKRHAITLISIATLCTSVSLRAETLYVTDRILLGVHQDAAETSMVIATIPSGTSVNVLDRSDDFVKIRLTDGKEGWVSGGYLKKEKPAAAELDALNAQLKKEQENSQKLGDDLDKMEREVQVRRDELSNAKTTIKELQKALKDQGTPTPASAADSASAVPTKETEEQIKALQDQIQKLTDEKAALAAQSKNDSVVSLHELQNQNQQLQVRIEAALANLKGEKVPSAAELAAIRPSFPIWYWLLLIALFVGGVAAGVGWFDFHHRKRHGGFRI